MPYNWDLNQDPKNEELSFTNAASAVYEAETSELNSDLADPQIKSDPIANIIQRYSQELVPVSNASQPQLCQEPSEICPHCGANITAIKPNKAYTPDFEIVVYNRNSFDSGSSIPSSTRSSPARSSVKTQLSSVPSSPGFRAEDPIIISDDEVEAGADKSIGDIDTISSDFDKCNNRVPWACDEKLDLYILKLGFIVKNKYLSAIMNQKHGKEWRASSMVAQFAEYKYTPLNARLHLEVATSIVNGEFCLKYSDAIKGLRKAAGKVGIEISLRGREEIRIPQNIPTSRRRINQFGEDSDSDSSVSSSK
ncbi:hypothetical protein TWF730_008350 [Orbilia blumenaviensis]|uniref:Uncharacterized protein n=1 Tax=Orbilia blumenaviensis TaxID=1796055 RepID=A0AAV9V544_9PEZI